MTDFHEQDLAGSRFDQVILTGSRFTKVRLTETRFDDVHLGDVDIRGAYVTGSIRGAYVDLVIDAELGGLVVNGVDVVPEASGTRPSRAPGPSRSPTYPGASTTSGRSSRPLRHLGFATACWVGMALGVLNEEMLHRRFAERDLTAIENG
jgi:hypothetical protein